MSGATGPHTLRGMTWNHPRGYDPMISCSTEWRKLTGVAIEWDKRSLQDFESYPIQELARRYDLIVVDHPHMGQVTAERSLYPLDFPERQGELETLARGSAGASFLSYRLQGRQWALPIDAATQVQAWRPDLIDAPAMRWDEAIELAKSGFVLCPLQPPHSLMCFFTLCANLRTPCHTEKGLLIEQAAGEEAYALLGALVRHLHSKCFAMDPIAVLEEMARRDSRIACAPLIYGYVSYARRGFRPARIHFTDMPVAGSGGPVGSALGGTGIAVSSLSPHVKEAADFAFWVASGPIQRGLYASSGGQPGHADAWDADEVNEPVGAFYRRTRATLEGAWVRPRHNGYMRFQHWASVRLNEAFQAKETAASAISALNCAFAESFEDGF